MRVIGVIDLAGGMAVHARQGIRAAYRPVSVAAGCPIHGDAVTLAQTYVGGLGITELYVADLDAIADAAHEGPSTRHATTLARLVSLAPLWLDAGISTPHGARRALELGSTRAIVGLETLQSLDALAAICETAGPGRVAFSIDLHDGVPISPRLTRGARDVTEIASYAVGAGAGALIVIDLARVGSGTGLDLALLEAVRKAAPDTILIAGGGVRGLDDVKSLAGAGCDGALVATALHDGSLGPEDVRRLRHTSESL